MLEDYDNYLTPVDVAYELGVSLTTVYTLLREKKLPGFKVGSKIWRIPKERLIEIMEGDKLF